MGDSEFNLVEAEFSAGSFDDIMSKYQGRKAAVFCSNGAVLRGVVRFTDDGKWVHVEQENGPVVRMALCNLNYIVSIAAGNS